MKKIFLLLVLCLIGVAFFVNHTFHSVFEGDNNLSIKVRESENVYELRAKYHKRKTKMLQQYMDEQLHTDDLFSNSRMDGRVVLDDNTKLFVKTKPGSLVVRMKLDENDSTAYLNIKALEKGIRERLGPDL